MKNLMITSAAALLIGTTAGAALPTQAEEAPEESLFQGIQIASLSDHWDWVVARRGFAKPRAVPVGTVERYRY